MNIEEIQRLANLAAETEDQSVAKEFSGSSVPDEGPAVFRFVEYVEVGLHDGGQYKGKPKPPAQKVRLTFDVVRQKDIREYTTDDGETKKAANRVTVTVQKKDSSKSKFFKLFEAMRYGRPIKHMAQMLGEAFKGKIYHNPGEGDRVWVNLDKDGAWSLAAPRKEDEETGESSPMKVHPAISDMRIFLWDSPTKETWDSLYIDGTRERTVKDAKGNEVTEQVSKNFLQEICMSALDFEGSALQAMLGDVDDLPTEEAKPKKAFKPKAAKAKKAEEEVEEVEEVEEPAVEESSAQSEADEALAAMGFDE